MCLIEVNTCISKEKIWLDTQGQKSESQED
jgi:hypothetical protein